MSVLYTQDPPLCLQRYISFIPFFVLKGAWKTLKQKVVVFLDQIRERPTACQRTHTKVVTFANHSRSGEQALTGTRYPTRTEPDPENFSEFQGSG